MLKLALNIMSNIYTHQYDLGTFNISYSFCYVTIHAGHVDTKTDNRDTFIRYRLSVVHHSPQATNPLDLHHKWIYHRPHVLVCCWYEYIANHTFWICTFHTATCLQTGLTFQWHSLNIFAKLYTCTCHISCKQQQCWTYSKQCYYI